MNRRAALTAALVPVAVAAIAAVVIAQHRTAPMPAAGAGDPGVPAVPLVSATYGSFVEHVRAPGRVGSAAGGETKLAFAAAGIIASLGVHVGDQVAAGMALAQLDTGGLALDLEQARDDARAAAASYGDGSVAARASAGARARLDAARARLTSQLQAKIAVDTRALTREQALFAGGVAAAKDVDAARAQLALDQGDAGTARADVAQAQSDVRAAQAQGPVAQAQLASARVKLAAAQRNLANAVLRAPVAGIVTAVFKHAGESTDPSTPVVAIGSASGRSVTLTAVGADARAVRIGNPVTFSAGSGAASATGTVRSVLPSVDPVTQTTTIIVEGAPPGAVAGDAVEASITIATRRGIVIPNAAIVDEPQTGKAIVFVRTRTASGEATFVAREVTIGAADERSSLVVRGLRAGERIAGEGAYDLLAPSGGGG